MSVLRKERRRSPHLRPLRVEPPRAVAAEADQVRRGNLAPAALEQGLTATVELEIVVAADGTVKEAKVAVPVGNGFDEAAIEAAKQFLFEPARKNGQPIGARVTYPYVFEMLKEEVAPEPDAPPAPAQLEGSVLAVEDDAPLGSVRVIISMLDGSNSHSVMTTEDGRFTISDLPAGVYSIRLEREERVAREQQEELITGQATSVVYRMQEPRDPDAFGAVARIPPPPREVTRRTIAKEQLTPSRYARRCAASRELMPAGTPAARRGLLIVRGSAPADTQPLMEACRSRCSITSAPHQLHQLALAQEHRLLPGQLLGALRPPPRRHHRDRPRRHQTTRRTASPTST